MRGPATREPLAGAHCVVDDIPFDTPLLCRGGSLLLAAFTIDIARAAELLPHAAFRPFRLWNRGVLVVTAGRFHNPNLGTYVGTSFAIACTRGAITAPRLLPALLQRRFGFGQFILDFPVNTELAVKAGKGIWGMPKHEANLNFIVANDEFGEIVSIGSQYDCDGEFGAYVEISVPQRQRRLDSRFVNYSNFRGMIAKSSVEVRGKLRYSAFRHGAGRLLLGDHPRVRPLATLDIARAPIFTGFIEHVDAIRDDDRVEAWLGGPTPFEIAQDGLESVVSLGQSRRPLPEPDPAHLHGRSS